MTEHVVQESIGVHQSVSPRVHPSAARPGTRPLRVLMVSVALPTTVNPNTTAPQARQMESLRAAGVQVDVLEVKGVSKFKYMGALPRLYQMVEDADLVHAHYGYCGWLARCQMRKPVVVSFMGTDLLGAPDSNGQVDYLSRLVVQVDRWFARTVDAVIVKSQEMADLVKPVHAHVVPNGVDMELFQPTDKEHARAELAWPADRRYILFPGNPANPRKGYPLAESAVFLAREKLESLPDDIPTRLVVLHNVPPDQVPLYMNACDAMLMTSLNEGSPNVVKEAMACNLPIISVSVGDTAELLDGVPGYHVCPRDASALADGLVATLTTPVTADGRAALLRHRLDLESVAQRLLAIYEETLR